MKTSHIYQIEIIEPEYTDLFHCHIEFETIEHGLRCDVTLVDNEDSDNRLTIASAISEGYDMGELHDDAISILNRKDYCINVFKKFGRKSNNQVKGGHNLA